MNRVTKKLIQGWSELGPRFLPFADAASADLPLSRLLRLSLFQVSVGMALVLLVGTLNRVMIVELHVPASIVSVMISLPILFAPFRALIGFRSDNHQSALGWRRVPYIWMGTLVQFGGLAIMPFALLVLSGGGQSSQAPVWIGWAASALAFLFVGAGVHMTQTVGLALATDLAPVEAQPKVVGLMYVMQLFGMIISALAFGLALEQFSPARLIQVIQASALITLILNVIALWKQETRTQIRSRANQAEPSFMQSWRTFTAGGNAVRRVSATTALTATLAIGGLWGFTWASRVLSRGSDPFRMATLGAYVGIPAFIFVIAAAPLQVTLVFILGTFLIGFGGGLFSHGTLTATMNFAPAEQRGLALGAWGAVQASAAGIAIGLGGVIRDLVVALGNAKLLPEALNGPAIGYSLVYALEIGLLIVTILAMMPLLRTQSSSKWTIFL